MLVLASLVITASCSWAPRYTLNKQGSVKRLCDAPVFYVLRNVEGRNIEPIIAAADYWNDALGKRMFIYGGEDLSGEIESTPHMLTITQLDILPDACGWAHRTTRENGCVKEPYVILKTSCMKDSKWTETLARHELGHILGLKDSDGPTHLMNTSALENHKFYVATPTEPVNACESEIEKLKEIY